MTNQPHGLARGLTNYEDAGGPGGMVRDGSPADPANRVDMAADLPADVVRAGSA